MSRADLDAQRALKVTADLMRDWKTGQKSSEETLEALFLTISSTPAIAAPSFQANPQAATYPGEIWLQAGECNADEALPYTDGLELTWCWESIDRMDVRYVRGDLATQTPVQGEPVELPPLPERGYLGGDEAFGDAIYGYNAYDMREYARAAIDAARKFKPAGLPSGWAIVEKETCFALLDGNTVVASLSGAEAPKNAAIIARAIEADRKASA